MTDYRKLPGDSRPKAGSPMPMLNYAGSVLLSALREIFDESAYTRFLGRNRIASSTAAYAAFMREQGAAKVRHPRCC